MSCCETQNLAVGYDAPLLRDIALHAERGKILALIGPNGAGKSTLLKTLAGQLAAQNGAVLLDGKPLTTYPPNARSSTQQQKQPQPLLQSASGVQSEPELQQRFRRL